MTKINQTQLNQTGNSRLSEIESQLTLTQLRFIVARVECKSDKEAAEMIGVTPAAVKSWNEDGSKQLVDEALKLMAHDGIVTALEIRRRNLARAMAVKASGLDSRDERVRQASATEIIEWELGKATQRSELTGRDGQPVQVQTISDEELLSELRAMLDSGTESASDSPA